MSRRDTYAADLEAARQKQPWDPETKIGIPPESYPFIHPDEIHKKHPVFTGNDVQAFAFACRSFQKEHVFQAADALDPDRQSYDKYHRSVTIGLDGVGTLYRMTLRIGAAEELYEALKVLLRK